MIMYGGNSNTICIFEKKKNKENYCLKILAYLGLQKSVFVMYNLVFVACIELQIRWAFKDNSEMIFPYLSIKNIHYDPS